MWFAAVLLEVAQVATVEGLADTPAHSCLVELQYVGYGRLPNPVRPVSQFGHCLNGLASLGAHGAAYTLGDQVGHELADDRIVSIEAMMRSCSSRSRVGLCKTAWARI